VSGPNTGGKKPTDPAEIAQTVRDKQLQERNDRIDRRIRRGICVGC